MSPALTIPELSLVVLAGVPSGFAARLFPAETILPATDPAAVEARLAGGRLTVVDGPNLHAADRRVWTRLAHDAYVASAAVAFQVAATFDQEGFRTSIIVESKADLDALRIAFVPLRCDRRAERPPFDIIGDVHGCADELEELLDRLGYLGGGGRAHPEGRRAIFVGDIVDRGPRVLDSFALVLRMVRAGSALCLPGNHDVKFARLLRGHPVTLTHGLSRSAEEVAALPAAVREDFSREALAFLDALPLHLVLDEGRLVVAHAGLPEPMHGREVGAIREFALYGDTTGERDQYGLPVRRDWAASYHGAATVVYGHTPVAEPEWVNETVNLDTGCVFGGALTALRYPEREFVSVPAHQAYWPSPKPFRRD